MRSFVATLLGAGAALCVAGQALAQAPTPAPAAPVPDQMPFDIPYGPAITADRAAQVVPPRWRKQRSHRAIGNSQSRSSIQTAISSTSTRWIRRRWHRSAFPRARLARRRVTGGRPAPSSRSCRTRPAPIYPRSIRRLSPPPAGSRLSRAVSKSMNVHPRPSNPFKILNFKYLPSTTSPGRPPPAYWASIGHGTHAGG